MHASSFYGMVPRRIRLIGRIGRISQIRRGGRPGAAPLVSTTGTHAIERFEAKAGRPDWKEGGFAGDAPQGSGGPGEAPLAEMTCGRFGSALRSMLRSVRHTARLAAEVTEQGAGKAVTRGMCVF